MTSTWYAWNLTWASDTTASASSTNVWPSWNNTATGTAAAGYAITSSTTTSDTSVWVYWNGEVWQSGTPIAAQESTPEQIAEAERRAEAERQAAQERRDREQKERVDAKKKATTLLLRHLSRSQRKEYKQSRCFTVISASGERQYRIEQGRSRNVKLIGPQGQVLRTYCAHPIEQVPDEDTMLAQMLMLRNCEDEFLRLANVS